jgi:acetyl-CoA carboxylase carboxyl transferase subunit beta
MARSPTHSGTRKPETDHDIHPPISDGDPMSWLSKLMPKRIRTQGGDKRKVPEGLWGKCEGCGAVLYQPELEANQQVCPKCNFHMPIGARDRLRLFLDENTGTEIGADLLPADALKFKDSKKYKDRLVAAQKQTGENRRADRACMARLKGMPVAACAFEFSFMAGSMGSVVGERFTLAANIALASGYAAGLLLRLRWCAHAGSAVLLMQMAKTSAALARLREVGLPFISVLTDPTTGGVSASFAMLGDINVGEPQGADRLCRPARDRADRARNLAGRLPAQRVPAGARRHRPDRRSAPDARQAR